ncbi:hypothetical protein V6N11_047473 [Hibiscus sabdariffa]|uniref:Uncharacterized protein n=1 Tax=Hibiscus sabdariffa TaxID=183260 RepID=A0ABR2NKJ2_9ROSI
MEGSLDEAVGMVRRTGMNVERLVEGRDFEEIMMPRTTQQVTGRMEDRVEEVAGAEGNVAVVERELESATDKDRAVNLISNSVFDFPSNFDENLTIVPIGEIISFPIQSVVPQAFQCPSEVVVSGGVPRKVRSVNDLVLAELPGEQRAVLQKAQGRKKGRKVDKVG